MAVLAAAAARGWQLADVRAAVASGAWRGLAELYDRRSEPGRMARLLPYEWRKAIDLRGREENPRNWHTSDLNPRPPVRPIDGADMFGQIRRWMTGSACAARGPGAGQQWGRRADRRPPAARWPSARPRWSPDRTWSSSARRNLALHAALSQRTVPACSSCSGRARPADRPGEPRRLARADRYQLRIPDRLRR